jgi:PAS domain S-box-containing protein
VRSGTSCATTTRNFSGSQSTLAESGLEQSKVGIRVDLPIGYDINMVGRVETGFNPLSGELTDACRSIVDNSGVPQGKQTANADSSRCGQAFNGPAFGGLSHKVYGTLTIGRQQSLQLDALAVYDPRVVLTHALKRKGLDFDAVAELLDETSQELRFSRQLLQATLENITQAISVVDADMRIVAWNRRYLGMFGYPPDMVYVGRPVEHLIRWNATRGEFGDGDVEQHVEKRLAHLRAGTSYTFQRLRRNGQVYSVHGQPMAGGGFVTTYTDVTDFKRTKQALLDAKLGLEARVALRTRELCEALEAQRLAKQEAEQANRSKTRFVAAASHDLLQPLNAARLCASALESRVRQYPEFLELASRIDASMRAAEELLSDLLDVARLDSGVLKPDIVSFQIGELLDELRRQYAPLAQARKLRLDVVRCRDLVRSDRVLLRRILQNYLAEVPRQ